MLARYFLCRADEAASEGRGLEGAAGRLKDENRRLVSQAAHLQAQLDCTSSEARSKSAGAALDFETALTFQHQLL